MVGEGSHITRPLNKDGSTWSAETNARHTDGVIWESGDVRRRRRAMAAAAELRVFVE